MDADPPPKADEQRPWNELLGTYVEVWLYSIQFGLLSGLSFMLMTSSYYDMDRWGLLGLPLILLQVASGLAALLSWYALLRYLGRCLIPKFILKDQEHAATQKEAARYLYQSMWFFFMAFTFRLTSTIFDTTMLWLP